MSEFYYKVKNKKNKITEGCIKASDKNDAINKLEKKKLTVISINELSKSEMSDVEIELAEGKKVEFSLKEKIEFISSLSMMYESGISIEECLQTIVQTVKHKHVSHYCASLIRFLNKGLSFSETLKKLPPKPGIAYTALIAAGDEAGELEAILSDIQKNLQREETTKHELISALTYPAFMFVFAIVVFLFFKFFILKIFEVMAADVSSLCITSIAIAAGFKIIGVLLVTAIFILIFYKNIKLRKAVIELALKLPIITAIVNDYEYMNYFSVFSLAYKAGVPITETLKLSDSILKTKTRKLKLKKAESMLDSGCELAIALASASCFSTSIISRIAAGEKSGKLDKALAQISSNFEKSADLKIKTATKMLEPIMMIFIGIMVALLHSEHMQDITKAFFRDWDYKKSKLSQFVFVDFKRQ